MHEWMAGQLWNRQNQTYFSRGFGIITVDTTIAPATARLEFFDQQGNAREGKRLLYTTSGALRALWNSPPGVIRDPPRAIDGELRPDSGPVWDALPSSTGETLTLEQLRFPPP